MAKTTKKNQILFRAKNFKRWSFGTTNIQSGPEKVQKSIQPPRRLPKQILHFVVYKKFVGGVQDQK